MLQVLRTACLLITAKAYQIKQKLQCTHLGWSRCGTLSWHQPENCNLQVQFHKGYTFHSLADSSSLHGSGRMGGFARLLRTEQYLAFPSQTKHNKASTEGTNMT